MQCKMGVQLIRVKDVIAVKKCDPLGPRKVNSCVHSPVGPCILLTHQQKSWIVNPVYNVYSAIFGPVIDYDEFQIPNGGVKHGLDRLSDVRLMVIGGHHDRDARSSAFADHRSTLHDRSPSAVTDDSRAPSSCACDVPGSQSRRLVLAE